MGEVDEFLAAILPRLTEADTALHDGDAELRKAMWSRSDPVTVFGASLSGTGWKDVAASFDAIAQRFSNCTAYEIEVIAAGASGDIAYLAAIEHITSAVAGGEAEPYELRATTIFRREDGEWKAVHRHGDPAPGSAGARSQRQRMLDDLGR